MASRKRFQAMRNSLWLRNCEVKLLTGQNRKLARDLNQAWVELQEKEEALHGARKEMGQLPVDGSSWKWFENQGEEGVKELKRLELELKKSEKNNEYAGSTIKRLTWTIGKMIREKDNEYFNSCRKYEGQIWVLRKANEDQLGIMRESLDVAMIKEGKLTGELQQVQEELAGTKELLGRAETMLGLAPGTLGKQVGEDFIQVPTSQDDPKEKDDGNDESSSEGQGEMDVESNSHHAPGPSTSPVPVDSDQAGDNDEQNPVPKSKLMTKSDDKSEDESGEEEEEEEDENDDDDWSRETTPSIASSVEDQSLSEDSSSDNEEEDISLLPNPPSPSEDVMDEDSEDDGLTIRNFTGIRRRPKLNRKAKRKTRRGLAKSACTARRLMRLLPHDVDHGKRLHCICGNRYQTKVSLKRHIHYYNQQGVNCDICKRDFRNVQQRNAHRGVHFNQRTRSRKTKCGHFGPRRPVEEAHGFSGMSPRLSGGGHEGLPLPGISSSSSKLGGVQYFCKCGEQFPSNGSFQEHIHMLKLKGEFSCSYCPCAFKNRRGLKQHLRNFHRAEIF